MSAPLGQDRVAAAPQSPDVRCETSRAVESGLQSGQFRVEEITSEEALDALAREWRRLSEQSDTALLFNTHEWASACWRQFHRVASGRDLSRLWVLAVRDSACLRAVVPLWVETRRFLGMPTRIARFVGEGPSDYGDLLLAAPRRPALEAIIAHLAVHGAPWDVLDLREFFGESPNLSEWIKLLASRGWWVRQTADSPCQTIPTEGGWDAYYRGRFNSKRRRDQRRERRSLDETGTVTQEVLTDATLAPGLADTLAAVQAAHADAGEHRPGEFNDPAFRSFLEEMLTTATARGWLRVPILRRDGVLLAYYIAFLYRGRYYVYNTAHRADCQAYGVGKLLMLYIF